MKLTKSEVQNKIRAFQKVDDDLARIIEKFSQVQAERLSETRRFGPWYKDHSFRTGSQVEGGLYARMFRYDDVKHIIEVDMMFTMGNIADPENQLESIQNLPGYFSVQVDGIGQCFHNGVREKFFGSSHWKQQSNDKFLARSTVMGFLSDMFVSTPLKSRANLFMVDTLLQPEVPCKEKVSFPQKEPSVKTKVRFTSGGKHLFKAEADTVCCFQLSFWPDEWGFIEWLNRKRKWPTDKNVINEIQHMVHIVPKSAPNNITESDKAKCWRLSFFKAEIYLKSLFSSDQREVYLFFKILFYANISKIKIDGKRMSSYICKTTMLWTMEEDGPNFGQTDFLEAIKRLFSKLKQFLDGDDGLPNFFYPQINTLGRYSKDLIKKCSIMTEQVMQQPLVHLPPQFVKICDYLEKFHKRLEDLKFESFMDDLHDFVKSNPSLQGATAVELFWRYMQRRNWRVRFLFHPLVRALMASWVSRKLHSVKEISCTCLPFHRLRRHGS